MSKTLDILLLKTRKSPEVQHSLMNDETLRDFSIILTTEPHVVRAENGSLVTPLVHHNY